MRAKLSRNGWSIAELLVVLAIVGMFVGLTSSAIESGRRQAALQGAVSEMRSVFQHVRMMAIARNCHVAIKFRLEEDGWSWAVYQDGDGDGVRNNDIRRGIDRLVIPRRKLLYLPARIGVPDEPVTDPMNGRTLSERSAVRFGTSGLCSFSKHGEATNGSLVLTDGDRAVLLRVTGSSARIHVLQWRDGAWRSGV